MRYSKPGYGDPCTWGPVTTHPNDPRNDFEKQALRLEKLTLALCHRIKDKLLEDDDTALLVADQLIRYLTDIEVVDIVRDVEKGKKESVFLAVRKLVDEAIEGLAENRASEQLGYDC